MTVILLACIPVALGIGLLGGFAMGWTFPRDSVYPSLEDERELRQRVWDQHWAATHDWAATHEVKPNASGDLQTTWMNVAHTHDEH